MFYVINITVYIVNTTNSFNVFFLAVILRSQCKREGLKENHISPKDSNHWGRIQQKHIFTARWGPQAVMLTMSSLHATVVFILSESQHWYLTEVLSHGIGGVSSWLPDGHLGVGANFLCFQSTFCPVEILHIHFKRSHTFKNSHLFICFSEIHFTVLLELGGVQWVTNCFLIGFKA